MKRGIDGHIVIGAKQAKGQAQPRGRSYVRKTVAEMTTAYLRSQLCSMGPQKCRTCGLCEYGKEFSRRMQEKKSKGADAE